MHEFVINKLIVVCLIVLQTSCFKRCVLSFGRSIFDQWCMIVCLHTLYMQSDDATVSMEGTGEADEMEFRVSELAAKVKDLERKVADLFMDNVALKTKLEASRKIEKEQQEEITSLKERLVQALRAQVNVCTFILCASSLAKHS